VTAAGRIQIEVDDDLARLIGPSVKPPIRRAFLDAHASQPPEWQVKGLFYLACQGHGSEATDALERLRGLPPNVVDEAYRTRRLEAPIRDFLAREFGTHTAFLGRLILNNELSEDAFHFLVLNGTDAVIDTVRRRNMNLLNSPAIIEALFENQKVRKGTVDRILQILGLEVKISVDEDEEGAEAAPEVEEELDVEEVEEVDPVSGTKRRVRRPMTGGDAAASAVFNPDLFRSFLEGREFNFAAGLTGEDQGEQLSDDERITLYQSVMKMSVAEKIVLAIRGNREARNLLLRDSNRLIPLYVLQNARITEEEISQVTTSPSSSRELISEISRNREWTRAYKVKRALAVNAKTPLDKAMRFLNTLNYKDVRDISRSKNVPSALAIQAKRLVQRKQDTGKMSEGGGGKN
jgi:hypothetical protein